MEIFRRNYLSTALLLFALAALSFACEAQSKEQSSKLEAINELVSTYAEYGQFNGAILVAHEGELVYKQGFGLANMEWEIPNQTDTKFRLGSISKQFTAMLIMQLVAEGKLELNAPLARYLPDYPKENAERITIHQLLTHSAGVPNNYDSPKPKVDKPDLIIPDNYRPQDLVAVFSGLPLDFTPGVRFSYSNSGYVVLGYLIEQITEKSFAQVLEEKILQPLGMKNTGIEKHRPLSANRAAGYFQAWGTYYNANYVDMSSVFSAGAIYSTVEDLWLWDQALYEEKLLPKAYLAQIFSQQISDPDYGGHYGYGWSLTD
ncbi:MAG: serine hydrolase domain-containing protein, partial [Bacteroidota bacterium]